MNIKEVYETLEKVENGAELIGAIKAEVTKLNDEAKKHRTAGEASADKVKKLLESLGIEDNAEAVTKAAEMKATLETFAKDGKKPSEVAKMLTSLNKQVEEVTGKLNEMTKTASEEKMKRLNTLRNQTVIELLAQGKAASPKDMAEMVNSKIRINDDESFTYLGKENAEMSIEDGVKEWLAENKWAVQVSNNKGGGSSGGGNVENDDPFLAGFNS